MAVDEAGRVAVAGIRSNEQLTAFLAAPIAKSMRREPDALPPGAAEFLRGDLDAAVRLFGKQNSAEGRFRHGVALRARSETDARRPGDAQKAVVEWQAALAMNPNQYIWRRRIQQYGPRLAKPYNFYGWVAEARRVIEARGDTPVPLRTEPRGAELLAPNAPIHEGPTDRDPDGKIDRDKGGMILVETIVTPPAVRPGGRVRVRLLFRPGKAKWNNEGQVLSAHLGGRGLRAVEGGLIHAPAKTPHSTELRVLECEVQVAGDAKPGRHTLLGYALYDVCVDEDGTCRYLRQDLSLPIEVSAEAVKLGR